MKKILAFLILLAPFASAQVVVNPGGGGGSSTVTAGTTATSGCTDTAFLRSASGVIQCGANALNDGSTVTFDNGAAAASILIAKDNGTAVFTIADGGIVGLGTDGTLTAPAFGWSADMDGTGTGFWRSAANRWVFSSNGTRTMDIDVIVGVGSDVAMTLGSSAPINFNSGTVNGNATDLKLSREAAATLQMGADVNGAAVNQTLKAHDGITGTDIKGASLTLAPGLGTGAAVSNPLTINRVVTKATGTTAQTYSPAVVYCPTKILSNTSATAQTIATITTTSTTGGSVTMDYTTVANNGTLQDTDSGMVKVSWNNNAGTVAAAMTAVALQSDSDASGTLATTPTATVATNVVSIKFTPTWVTIVPTTVTGWATFTLHTSGDTVVCQ